MTRWKAALEVIFIYSLTLILIVLVSRPPVGAWERAHMLPPFVEYAVMFTCPLAWLKVTRRSPAAYGLRLRPLAYHVDIAGSALVPVALSCVAFAWVDYRSWQGALLLAALQSVVLGVVARQLSTKPSGDSLASSTLLLGLTGLTMSLTSRGSNAIATLLFYLIFLVLGEEFLFRGFIQSRLNEAWGRPFRLAGTLWEWGWVVTAALFGAMHALNLASLVSGRWDVAPWWGFWTFFSGLVYGLLREKSGSILAPALVHGVPQAVVYTLLAFR